MSSSKMATRTTEGGAALIESIDPSLSSVAFSYSMYRNENVSVEIKRPHPHNDKRSRPAWGAHYQRTIVGFCLSVRRDIHRSRG